MSSAARLPPVYRSLIFLASESQTGLFVSTSNWRIFLNMTAEEQQKVYLQIRSLK